MDLCEKFVFWCSWNGWKVGLYISEMKFCQKIKCEWIQVVFSTLSQNKNMYLIFWLYSKSRFERVSKMWILVVTFGDRICRRLSLQRCHALPSGKQLPAFRRVVSLFYLFTAWSRVLLEKLTGSQLIKKFPAFCRTRRFITLFTSAWNLSLSWARLIQSTPLIPLPEYLF
jgi:hypothetical protein